MSLPSMAVLCVALAAPQDLASKLRSRDAVTVESARRELCAGARDAVPEAAVVAALDAASETQRAAAASVLLHHGLGKDAMRARFEAEASPLVRTVFVRALDKTACLRVIREDSVERVAQAAFIAFADRSAVTDEVLLAALTRSTADEPGLTTKTAARYLVFASRPLPGGVLAKIRKDDVACTAVLAAMTDHPRPSAAPWLDALLDQRRESPAGRLEVFAAHPRGALTAAQGREIVSMAGELDRPSRMLEAATRLPPEVADKIVGSVHQLASEGLDVSVALEALRPISERGERMLASLARVSAPDHREAIVDWLAARESPVVAEMVRDMLDADERIDVGLLRRASRVVGEPKYRALVQKSLRSRDVAESAAAFLALVQGEVFVPEMIEYVEHADEPEDSSRRARELFQLPGRKIPARAWTQLLTHENDDVKLWALRKLFEHDSMTLDFEDEIVAVAQKGGSLGLAARRLLAARGRSGAVEDMWRELDREARMDVVTAFQKRKVGWVRGLVDSAPERDTVQFESTRLRLGDEEVLEKLIQNPKRWTSKWLRRAEDPIVAALRPEHLPTLRAHVAGQDKIDEWWRIEVVGWLVRRPDLEVGRILELVHRGDPDIGIREHALEGLVLHPEGKAVRNQVETAIGQPMDEDTEDLAHAIVGALSPPLDGEQARLVARLLFVAPLGDPAGEIAEHLEIGDGDSSPGTVMINMAMQTVRSGVTQPVRAAFLAAAAEAREHPGHYALGRARLGRILTEISRRPESRAMLGDIVAQLVLDAPDLDARYVGPAQLVLAERYELEGDFARAVGLYAAAGRSLLWQSPAPFVRRVFLADDDPGAGVIPSAWLAARPDVCLARVAIAEGNPERARAALLRAMDLARGDVAAESEIRSLLAKVTK